MRILRRLGLVLVAIVLVVVLAALGIVAYITGRSLPQTTGTLHAPGLTSSVSVARDVNGIPQVVADNPHDLFFAQGYVHAQDRLWQMEVWRHISSGRLSELFGESELDTDKYIRTLGWRIAAQRDLEATTPEMRAVLQAYADGVNAWLAANKDRLGLSFVVTGLKNGQGGGLAGYRPERWTPLDSIAWAKVQAWNVGGNLASEIFRVLVDAKLGDSTRTDQLFPAYDSSAPVIVPTGLAGSAGATGAKPASLPASVGSSARAGSLTPAQAAALERLATLGRSISAVAGLDPAAGLVGAHGIGSNNWVVGPSKSATGHALLANDLHLGIAMPSIWYLNGLHCRVVGDACPYDVVGASFPGDPLVIVGHNRRIAWGATNVNPDVQDLFVEKVDPADPSHYLFKGQSLPFNVRSETIRVAGGDPVTIRVRETGHGPILNDVEDDLSGLPDLYALRWTATTEADHVLEAIERLDRATNFDDFRAALQLFGAPAQNFVYADVDGHIAYQTPGYIPVRADPKDRGDRPVPGWDGKHEWVDRIAFDDLPRIFDPPSGMIVTANNAVIDDKSPLFISQEWDPGYRASRILERLGSAVADGVTVDEMSAIQLDTKVLRASKVIPHLSMASPGTADGQTVLSRIQAWNGTCDVSSEGCAAYLAFEEQLIRNLFDDDLGDGLADDYVGSEIAWQSTIALLDSPRDPYWDDVRTSPYVESEPDVLKRALDGAGGELRTALGSDRHWTWGRLHTVTFEEQTLGTSGIGPLEWYYNSGPHQAAGAAGAVNNTNYDFSAGYPDPRDPSYEPAGLRGAFAVASGPSLRFDIDMGDLDGARIIQTTGQSGNPFDRHYGDFIVPWLEGQQVPLPFSSGAVSGSTTSVLMLLP